MSMWRNGKPCTLFVGLLIVAATIENSMEVPRKVTNKTII